MAYGLYSKSSMPLPAMYRWSNVYAEMNDDTGRLLITSDMLKDPAFVKKLHEDK